MDKQDIVESYFEDYFGHDLFETLSNEEIAEAIVSANILADALNEFFDISEQRRRASDKLNFSSAGGAAGILAPGKNIEAFNTIAAYTGAIFERRSGMGPEQIIARQK